MALDFKIFLIFWNTNLAFMDISSMELGSEDSRKMELAKKLVTWAWFTGMKVSGFTYFLKLCVKLCM